MTPLIVILGLPANVHHCTSHREGAWIVWRCPLCEGYERRFNLATGQMRCTKHPDGIVHTGMSNAASNMEALALNQHQN